MIVVDTTVLVYAVGVDHPLRESCRRLVEAARTRTAELTTTVEVIQEFVHVRARRRSKRDAIMLGKAYAALLHPLLAVDERDFAAGLDLFGSSTELGPFDAVLATAAIHRDADALVSADRAFEEIEGVAYLHPTSRDLGALIGSSGE